MPRKQIEITAEMLQECERLAALGLNEKQISESLGMAYSSFQKHKARFREVLKKGRQSLRERVSTKILNAIDEDNITAQIFVAKRLGLFQASINATAPDKAIQVSGELSRVYQMVSDGSITADHGEKLSSLLSKISSTIETVELEKRIEQLEQTLKET